MAKFSSSAAAGYFKPEFMTTIKPRTLSRLRIPPKFFEKNMAGGHQDHTVTLISDQLACPWEVTLEGLTLKDGWPDFVRAFKLKVSDVLVFTYKGNYVFEVTGFGGNGEKLEHEYWEQDEDAIDGGISSSGKGKGKQVEKEHGQSSKPHRNGSHGVENFGNSSLMPRGTRSYENVAVEDITSFNLIATESNIARNGVYLPKRFVELNGLNAKDISFITLTNNDGATWKAAVTVCCDERLKIGRCWAMFCSENGIAPEDCCEFKLVENTDNIVIELVGVNDDNEVEEVFPAARVQTASSSGPRLPKVEGASMYSTAPDRSQRGKRQRK